MANNQGQDEDIDLQKDLTEEQQEDLQKTLSESE
jgi:hypothetical protein